MLTTFVFFNSLKKSHLWIYYEQVQSTSFDVDRSKSRSSNQCPKTTEQAYFFPVEHGGGATIHILQHKTLLSLWYFDHLIRLLFTDLRGIYPGTSESRHPEGGGRCFVPKLEKLCLGGGTHHDSGDTGGKLTGGMVPNLSLVTYLRFRTFEDHDSLIIIFFGRGGQVKGQTHIPVLLRIFVFLYYSGVPLSFNNHIDDSIADPILV